MLDRLDQAQIYTDFQGLAKLRSRAAQDSGAALDQVTQQFEAYFLQQLLKSGRAASLGDGLLQSDQERFFQGLLDQQLSLNLAGDNGLGLAKILREQIRAQYRLDANESDAEGTGGALPRIRGRAASERPPSDAASAVPPRRAAPLGASAVEGPFTSPEDFVGRLLPIARETAVELGVDPGVLIAQAALETGWGKAVIKHEDGSSSHNLFGIKADSGWSGDRVHANTLEYEDGLVVRKREPFRAYESFAESFRDYLVFLRQNPRYSEALNQTRDARGFVEALQQAGYATDPAYAEKILGILDGVRLHNASG